MAGFVWKWISPVVTCGWVWSVAAASPYSPSSRNSRRLSASALTCVSRAKTLVGLSVTATPSSPVTVTSASPTTRGTPL